MYFRAVSSFQQPIDYLKRPVNRLVANEAAIGILLFIAAAAAMVVANSSWGAEWYHDFWYKEITVAIDKGEVKLNFHQLVNDGLMAIFFFLVGLEMKREFLAGELNTFRKAAMPVAAAIGGMVVPALVYLALNDGEKAAGWGIPMATDIAFALGLINIVRKRIAPSIKVFVTSLAVVDDIGAVLVIAIFYTSGLDWGQLALAGGALAFLGIANWMGVRSTFFYSFIGITLIWVFFFYSGMHPTIAGILLAFTIPATVRLGKEGFSEKMQDLMQKYLKLDSKEVQMNTLEEERVLQGMARADRAARTPLQQLEHTLHPFVYFVILPIFAFANAGLKIESGFVEMLFGSIGLGILLGLLVGKIVGINLMAWLMVKLGIADLPAGSNWMQIFGASILAAIGFTMSLFIAELAFTNHDYADAAKAAILVASVIAGVGGLLVIRFGNKKAEG